MHPKPTKRERRAAKAARLATKRGITRGLKGLEREMYQVERAKYLVTLAAKQGELEVTDAELLDLLSNARQALRSLSTLKSEPTCEMRLGATGCAVNAYRATDIHHKRGRGKWLLDHDHFVGCCRRCHKFVEENRAWAYKEGWLDKRNQIGEEHAESDNEE